MGKHLIVAGHGGVDGGAYGNGTNERDFTRTYFVDQIAAAINSISGESATVYDKRRNAYTDTYNGGGIYWAKKEGFTTVTEIHQDAFTNPSASGGHVIVYKGFAPDAIDLGIRDVLRKYVGVRYTHKGHSGISGRNNLLQINVAAEIGVNYRLVELGFITNTKDFQNMKNNHKAISQGIAEAITGKEAGKNKTDKEVSDKKADTTPHGKTVDELANEVIAGKHGVGDARRKALGTQYSVVQSRVNEILSGEKKPAAKPTPAKPAAKPQEVSGVWTGDYTGKWVVSKVSGLRFYASKQWKTAYGRANKGWGFIITGKATKVGDGYMFPVKNTNGQRFYITAHKKYVDIK